MHSHLVYRYLCSSCNATYYGKTSWHFFTRAVEHIGISNLTGKHVKNVKESAVSDPITMWLCKWFWPLWYFSLWHQLF